MKKYRTPLKSFENFVLEEKISKESLDFKSGLMTISISISQE